MRIHRRQFLKYCLGSATVMGLPMGVVGKLEQAMAADGPGLPKVIWLNGANCSGCTVSLANLFSTTGPVDITDLLFDTIDLAFHPTLMAASGDLAVTQLKETASGSYILAIDGGIPTAFNGNTCILWTDGNKEVTALEAVEMLAPNASAVLSIGTCASYGGIPAGNPNPTGIVSVSDIVGSKTINIPGCPTHPDWIVWTIAHLLSGETPQLDERNRPTTLYGTKIHKTCPRKGENEAKTFGLDRLCLKELGCKGPQTNSDCPSRKWNNGTNWCIGASSICIGCTEPNFPDKFSPFYKIEYEYKQFNKPSPEAPQKNEGNNALSFAEVVWNASENKLTAEGKGTTSQIVTLYNADTSNMIGAVSVNSSGVWKFTADSPSPVPTQIKAVSGSDTIVSTVAGAPSPETDPPPTDENFELTRAVWRPDTKKFVVKGVGSAGAIVDIFNVSTGNKIAKATVKSDSTWRIVVKQPVTVPCSVFVVSNGKELTSSVKKAPSNCI